MYVTSVEKVREYEITEKGAKGVKVKYLLHKGNACITVKQGSAIFISSNEEHQLHACR